MGIANAAAVLFTDFHKLGKHSYQTSAQVVATKAASFAFLSGAGCCRAARHRV